MRYAVFFFALVLTVGTFAGNGARATELAQDHVSACSHYENRARFKSRVRLVDFVTVLAEACRAAQASLIGNRARERQTALVFLDRVAELRALIVQMNVQKRLRPVETADVDALSNFARASKLPRVSAAGELLIAHRMGLIKAFENWLESSPNFALVRR